MDSISILACEDEALFAAFTEQDDLWVCFEEPRNTYGHENELDLGTVISRVGSSEDNHLNILTPNLGDERKLAQTELKCGCGCPKNCYH